jgi:tape measure domain-containing protein
VGDKITINVGINSTQYQSGLAAMRKYTSEFKNDVRSQLVGAIGGFALLTGAVNLFKTAVQKASNMQQLAASFKTLLGSGEAAKKMLKDLADLAGRTPLGLNELAEAGKKLLAFGEAPEDIVKTLEMLGDVAAGAGAPLEDIASLYGKMRVQGKLYAEDLNQLLDRGIPILTLLAERFGVSEAAVKKLASEGKVSFADLEASLKKLTGAGGDWSGMMEAQSKTLAGKLAALEDAFNRLLVAFASPLLEFFAKKADGASESLGRWEKYAEKAGNVIRWLLGIVDLAIVGLEGLANIIRNSFVGALDMAIKGMGGLGQAMSELFSGNFAQAAETAKKTAEDLAKTFRETLQKQLDQAMKSGNQGLKIIGDLQRPTTPTTEGNGPNKDAAKKAGDDAAKEKLKAEEKIRERMQRLQENEAEAARDKLEGEAKINALLEERARLMQEAFNAPDDDARLDALEKEQKVRREIEAETARQQDEAAKKAEENRKRDEDDVLAIAQAREEEAKARKEAEFEQMTPVQKIVTLQKEKQTLEDDANRLEETDPEQAAKKRTEAIAVDAKLREERKKLADDESRKADEAKSKLEEDAKKRTDAQKSAASVPVSSLQAVGGGGRAGPSSNSDPMLREAQRQTQQQQEIIMLLRQQVGVTSAPQAAPSSL